MPPLSAADLVLPHTPLIPWEWVDLTQAHFAAFFFKAPWSAAGPDGITYDMIRELAVPLGSIYEDLMAEIRPGVVPVPARQLNASSDEWLHPQQHGFTQGRGAADALLALETATLSLCCLHMFSAAVFAELAQAFASLSTSWETRCALASGCPEPLLWRVTYSGFALPSGARQGDPLSGTLFLLAVDGWLRFAVIRWGWDIHFIMFADDLTMVVKALELLKDCVCWKLLLVLDLNWDKTKVLPVGIA
eukprot:5230529-Amphidinium_carterae.2